MLGKAKKGRSKPKATPVLDRKQLATAVKGQISDLKKIETAFAIIHNHSMIPNSESYNGSAVDEINDLRLRMGQIESECSEISPILSRLDKRATNIKPSLKKHLAK